MAVTSPADPFDLAVGADRVSLALDSLEELVTPDFNDPKRNPVLRRLRKAVAEGARANPPGTIVELPGVEPCPDRFGVRMVLVVPSGT